MKSQRLLAVALAGLMLVSVAAIGSAATGHGGIATQKNATDGPSTEFDCNETAELVIARGAEGNITETVPAGYVNYTDRVDRVEKSIQQEYMNESGVSDVYIERDPEKKVCGENVSRVGVGVNTSEFTGTIPDQRNGVNIATHEPMNITNGSVVIADSSAATVTNATPTTDRSDGNGTTAPNSATGGNGKAKVGMGTGSEENATGNENGETEATSSTETATTTTEETTTRTSAETTTRTTTARTATETATTTTRTSTTETTTPTTTETTTSAATETTSTTTETATPTTTETAAPTTTAAASSPEQTLAIVDVHADAEGPGRESDNLDDEYFVLENQGNAAIDLSEYSVDYGPEDDQRYRPFGDRTLQPDESVTVRTGSGSRVNPGDTVVGLEQSVLNNEGDLITIYDSQGTVVAQDSYDGGPNSGQ